ncbi:MAG TPA: nitrilase-related carbon-nitrogen hydrolase, partial [Puia sp.]|nr:nitrilase-related carbon-nitrogen hydrolase [Puia sp.]
MENIRIATAQFEHASGDKAHNLEAVRRLTARAAAAGAQAVAFHECSITGYSFARRLSKEELLVVAEQIPEGPGIRALTELARQYDITILAGLFEKDKQ